MNNTLYVFHRLLHSAKPVALWTLAISAITASLIAANLAQAANPTPAPVAPAVALHLAVVAHEGGLIDHSMLSDTRRLPEPDASLLHSDPNAYVPVSMFR